MTIVRHLPRFRRALRGMEVIAEREAWPRERIETLQLQRLNTLWRHAVVHVPYYRVLASRLALPGEFATLGDFSSAVPVLTKDEVKTHAARFLSESPDDGHWHLTGGSTGTPLRLFWSHAAHRENLWHKYRMEQAWGLDLFNRKVFLWGHSASFARGVTGYLQRFALIFLDRLRNRERFNAYCLGEGDLTRYVERLKQGGTNCLYGYSSAVALLAQHAAALGVELPELKLAILTAEPADDAMLEVCRAGFGANAAIEYGSVDCGVIAVGMPNGRLTVCDDRVFLETLPREDGRYDLVVTVLNNPSFPLLRFAIEDVTDAPLQTDTAGFAWLKNVSGRSNDALLSLSGRRVHPLVVKHAFEGVDGIRRFRAHQDETGRVVVQIESTDGVPSDQVDAARQQMGGILEGYAVETEVVESLAGNRAGKHRWVTSDLT